MSEATTSAKPAVVLMAATYAVGFVGIFVGFLTVNRTPASLTVATLLAVGAAGILSFVRHSIFWRADGARMGWSTGERNNFQIEVGLANLAWGLLAVAAVVFKWGIRVEAASFLVFGLYLGAVAVMLVTTPSGDRTRPWSQVAGMGLFAVALIVLGVWGMGAV